MKNSSEESALQKTPHRVKRHSTGATQNWNDSEMKNGDWLKIEDLIEEGSDATFPS
jgi:hypothetical protein